MLNQLYGHYYDKIVRTKENTSQFPVSIRIDGHEFFVQNRDDTVKNGAR